MENGAIKLTKPFKKANVLDITQGFNSAHQAIDIVAKYGTPLVAPENCVVWQLWNGERVSDDIADLERGYGVKLKGLETGNVYVFWHCNPVFPVSVLQKVMRGQIVAFMGNSGNVSMGGAYVPLSERATAPHRGTHLHLMVYSPAGELVDPVPLIAWYVEPTWTTGEWVAAWLAALGKIINLT